MIFSEFLYFNKSCAGYCDGMCNKAWGICNRPKRQLSDDPDDYEYLSDNELGEAQIDPGTYEGGYAKPLVQPTIHNKWCVRECERFHFCIKGIIRFNKSKLIPDCQHKRAAEISARSSDTNIIQVGDRTFEGYVPSKMGIGDDDYSDYIRFNYCLDCGKILSDDFPVSEKTIKELMDSEDNFAKDLDQDE